MGPINHIDEALKEYATPRQIEFIDAVNKHHTMRGAADALGINNGVISESITRLRKRAAACGYSPEEDAKGLAPAGYRVKGKTLHFTKGVLDHVYVKTDIDAEAREATTRDFIKSLSSEVQGLSPLIEPPPFSMPDLLVVVPWGDPHFGMYAWQQEAGDNFDLAEAKRLTLGAVDRLIASAPPAATAIILPLGDFFHMDDQTNRTPGHGHQLDADGRFGKVLDVGIQVLRHAILRALEKFGKVIVRCEPGNHDPHARWTLVFAMRGYFDNNPRVEVDASPAKHWFYRFGKVLIGSTHGDTIKQEQMLGVMASDRAEDWGVTRHRYFYSGHVHHTVVKEVPGLVCESFRTLAAKDAYAAGHGYRAGRDMVAIVHHKDHGEIERHRCDVAMLS
jgi:hypothetical protein